MPSGSPSSTVVTTNHGPFNADLAPLYRSLAQRIPVIAISHRQRPRARGIQSRGGDPPRRPRRRVPARNGPRRTRPASSGGCAPRKASTTPSSVARSAGVPLRIAAKIREKDEFAYYNERIKPLLGGDIEYLGEVGGASKAVLLRRRAVSPQPDRLARAVRHGDDRGPGMRHTGGRHALRLGHRDRP